MTGISRNKQSSWPTGPDQLELLVQKNALVGNNQASCSEDLPSKHNRINQPDHRIHRPRKEPQNGNRTSHVLVRPARLGMRSTSDATTISSCWLCLIVSAACNLASSARLKSWSSSSISAISTGDRHVTMYVGERNEQHGTVCIPEINLEWSLAFKFNACSESLRGVIFFWKSSAS